MKCEKTSMQNLVLYFESVLAEQKKQLQFDREINKHSYGCGFSQGYVNALNFVLRELSQEGYKSGNGN